jgi:hypothetical protein
LSASNVKPAKPATGADRKRGQHLVAAAVGAPERRTFEMPELCLPIRTTGLRSLPALMLLAASAVLGGCSGGDFGRTRADMRNDDMHRWLGAEATASVGLTASQFQLTENERQLRDLAYPFIEPPHSRPAWKSVFGDYQPLPSPWRQKVVFDRTTYGRALIDEPHRSHTSRYQQLIEDVRNDITRFEPFFASAARVIELDRKRSASLKMVSELSPREQDDAIARMEENTLIVQWVQQCLERRISSYRWALERLVIQTPDTIAADADRLIGELAAQTANPPVAAQPVIGRAVTVKG